MDQLSYALGLGIGRQLQQMGLAGRLSVDDFAQSIRDTLEGREPAIPHHEAQTIVQQYFAEQEKRQQKQNEERGRQAKEEGRRHLEENARRQGVHTTASGLQYEILREGQDGPHPTARDRVRCHYEGRLLDGTVFDSSYRRHQSADFGLQQVIAGWTEGLQLMSPGAKYRFHIPHNLAYGEGGAGADIPPYATLIFDVELLEIL